MAKAALLLMSAIGCLLGWLGYMEAARRIPDHLAERLLMPCQDALSDASQDAPDQDGATRDVFFSGGLDHEVRGAGTPVIAPPEESA